MQSSVCSKNSRYSSAALRRFHITHVTGESIEAISFVLNNDLVVVKLFRSFYNGVCLRPQIPNSTTKWNHRVQYQLQTRVYSCKATVLYHRGLVRVYLLVTAEVSRGDGLLQFGLLICKAPKWNDKPAY